jgi:large subunit ribosomal protein L27Ae
LRRTPYDGHSLNEYSWSLVPAETRDKYVSGAKTDSAPVIDLLSHGYAKLLGKGKNPNRYQEWEVRDIDQTND